MEAEEICQELDCPKPGGAPGDETVERVERVASQLAQAYEPRDLVSRRGP